MSILPDFGPARRNVAFRRLLAGGLLSALGSSMTSFAVVLQIWDLSRSSLDVGLLGLTFVPVLIVGLLGGSIADAVDRRALALATTACLMAVSAGFAAQAYAQFRQLWLLYALAMVQATLQATGAPARRTFVARLVPSEQLTAAIALNTLTGRITMLLGPALAGVITGAFGLRTCYAIDTVSFVASLYATARLPAMHPPAKESRPSAISPAPAPESRPPAISPAPAPESRPSAISPAPAPESGPPAISPAPAPESRAAGRPGAPRPSLRGAPGALRSSLRATAEGLRFIRHRPLLVGAFLTDLDAMLLGLPVALFPALNAAHFGGSPQTLGLLNAAPGVGGLLSALLSGPAARVSRQGRGMIAGTMIWGAAIACFGLTRSLPLALATLAVAGAADTLTVMYRGSMVQTVTPDEFRGRVSSVEYIIGTGGGPLGNVESGTVATLTTPTISAVSGGVGCFVVAALIACTIPAMTRYRAGDPASATGAVPAEAAPAD